MNGQFYDSSEAEDFYPFDIEDTEDDSEDYDDSDDSDDYDDYDDYDDIGDYYMGMEGVEELEDLDYPESDATESRRSRRRARSRRMRARLARARLARARARARRSRSRRRRPYRPPTRSKGPASKRHVQHVANKAQRNRAAIRNVDLQSKVKTDMLARGLSAQGKRISGNEYSQAASKVVDEFKSQFPDLVTNPIIKTALPLLPLLLLKPQKKGSGFEAVISDPRVWGPVLAGGLAVFNEIQGAKDKDTTTDRIDIPSASLRLAAGASQPLRALARNAKGEVISGKRLFFGTSNSAVAKVTSDGLLEIPAGVAADSTAEITVTDPETGIEVKVDVTVS